MSRTLQLSDSSGCYGQVVTFRKDWTMWAEEKRSLATSRVLVGFIYLVAPANVTCLFIVLIPFYLRQPPPFGG